MEAARHAQVDSGKVFVPKGWKWDRGISDQDRDAIVERLSAELVAALEDPAIAARLRDYGAEPAPLGTEAFAAFMAAEAAKWAPVVRAAGLGVD